MSPLTPEQRARIRCGRPAIEQAVRESESTGGVTDTRSARAGAQTSVTEAIEPVAIAPRNGEPKHNGRVAEAVESPSKEDYDTHDEFIQACDEYDGAKRQKKVALAMRIGRSLDGDEKWTAKAARELADYLSNGHGVDHWPPQPVEFDFDEDPPAPDWIVVRAIERGTVVMLSGDTGAAKSIVASSLLHAALSDEDWLGLPTRIDRLTVIDEENPDRLIRARLQALGVDNDGRERFRYFNRAGVAIGDGKQTDEWLRQHIEEFQPDLLIVDTLMAACSVEDSNSNDNAVKMMKSLRALANAYGVAVLVLHHERKPPASGKGTGAGTSMLGARQWAGQADGHMTLTVESPFIETEGEDATETLRTFIWRPAEKDRSGQANYPQRVAVTSEKDSDGRLLAMRVVNEGPIEDEETEEDKLAREIGALVQRHGAAMKTGEIAEAVGCDAKSGTWKRAIDSACDKDFIVKTHKGFYAPGETAPEDDDA